MKILITGANGFLGQHLTVYLANQQWEVIATGRGDCRIPGTAGFTWLPLDLTDAEAIESVLQQVQPEVIIHNAAMSKPDECNRDKAECTRQNIDATRLLLQAAKAFSPHFIYVSTDFVFGENGPHSEDTIPAPLNFYGESKLQAEQLVKQSGLSYSIMRPVFIYGPIWEQMKPTFLHWVKNNLEQGKPIRVVNDQQRTPTYVYDICKGLETMILQRSIGDYHLAGKDILSPYQMAIILAHELGLDASLIERVNSDTFPEPVQRAKRSGLRIDKAIAELGYHPVSFEQGVRLSFGSQL